MRPASLIHPQPSGLRVFFYVRRGASPIPATGMAGPAGRGGGTA